MERFAAEALKAERVAAIGSALDAGMNLYDIMDRFKLSESEIAQIVQDRAKPRIKDPDAIRDARTESRLLLPGRRP